MKKNKWIIGVLAAVLLVLAVSTGVVLAETLPETYVETTEPGEPSEVEPEEPENTPQPQETPTPIPSRSLNLNRRNQLRNQPLNLLRNRRTM